MQGTIAVISPSSTLTSVMHGILQQRGLSWVVIEAAQHDAALKARQLIENGVSVIISRGRTASVLREQLRVPIVEVKHTFFDCINAYHKAQQVSDKVAFLATSEGYATILEKARPFMPQVSICLIDPLGSHQATEAQLDRLQAEGVEVAIGGLSLSQAVMARGMHSIMSEADADAAGEAIDEALHLLQIEEERRRKRVELQSRYEMIQSILNCVSEGIFSVDGQRNITNLNSVATGYLGSFSIGDSIDGLLTQDYFGQVLNTGRPVRGALITLGRLSLTLSIAPISLDNQVIGAVATLQNQTEITAIERKMRRQLARLHLAEKTFDDIIGSSPALAKAKRLAQTYAAVDSTVMIEGETGTGKELFAQSIHNASRRRNGPFVAINCAAFAPGVLESELFGYVKGAFTGALNEGKAGVFELAHTGTIFLDEINETSTDIQVKLLRTLQERKVVRIGDDKVTPIDIRIITASNKRLPQLVAQGLFREDFFYRICVLKLHLPALSERRADIPELVRHLLSSLPMDTAEPSDELLQRLSGYGWPGNIRQLGNIVERLAVMSQGRPFAQPWLEEVLEDLSNDVGGVQNTPIKSELALLHEVLSSVRGNREEAAKRLQISTTTLWRRMKKYLDEDPGCFDTVRY
ncbi:sigma 54-interacting transcriptional regulator [Pseudomonas poae]|uniref:Sigma-54-dependent Fis family transcriptional regulator n=1 Tax=Pseudomonas poae TaxID=200451 RepID=A0A2S9E2R4_9PSED|nr:sigma 54-interacting transcriptional regulator [Pseudomonas poae]PRA20831.1 sigma-54-dependent Fis family transcriptional regulator [Pseudomonas poae]PRC09078.1 sigma-54-dependent Fis family transcriptional regulator [Pseudomonas poae]